MDIDIFVSTFGVKIGDKLYSHSLLEKDDTGENFISSQKTIFQKLASSPNYIAKEKLYQKL